MCWGGVGWGGVGGGGLIVFCYWCIFLLFFWHSHQCGVGALVLDLILFFLFFLLHDFVII